jgi:hypothetical protein
MVNSKNEFLLPKDLEGPGISSYQGIWADSEETIFELENYYNLDSFASLNEMSKDSDSINQILKRYTKMLQITVFGYNFHFGVNEGFYINEDSFVLKFEDGEERQLSYGGGTQTGRSMCAILYLNDDYDGGEIEFVNFNLKIKPKRGTLLLFPSNFLYSYKENKVTNGTKYSIVNFIHDRPIDEISKQVLEQ